jgi:hypothetical protein
MSDGGKGSAPRPYSVSQETFGNNFDRIFGKKKVAETRCYCYNCNKDRVTESGMPFVMTQMILCPTCGNKRCPHSTDHNLACTNSNEPGQPGSRY